ncbi:MAG TPA: pyrroline-5-carboxylate reductase [Actinobacteria bacterium]|nr:pyrroline-5-carboxylate reductase [Actinomycetes bacterium]HEX21494.1 pyrroline-5-carboxylate reductase [Actinomycetota bacterium]
MPSQVAFIGAGKMAEALIKGAVDTRALLPADIIAVDIDNKRLEYIEKTYGVTTSNDNIEAARQAKTIILAVKPQVIDSVLENIRTAGLSGKLIISIAAGVTTKHILAILGSELNLVRVMPNAPALVSRGISAIAAPPNLSEAEQGLIDKIFRSVGEVVFLDESLINQVTAISGSGPAYFFYFVKTLIQAGVDIGLTKKVATQLAKATIMGAAVMLDATELETEELIAMVASKGGTTEAALKEFDQSGVSDTIAQGVFAAFKRAQELDENV